MTGTERRERQRVIVEAIDAGKIHSQQDVVKVLRAAGIRVTQATASRDLDELGAVKGKDELGQAQYRIPNLGRGIYDDLAIGILDASKILVIKTPPGAAQLLAGRIDRAELKGVVGTIAGDDTIFVACHSSVPLRNLREELYSITDTPGAKRALRTKNRSTVKASR
jgi:transcriptional regulator of arginine metabolism